MQIKTNDIVKKSLLYAGLIIFLTTITVIMIILSGDIVSSIINHNAQILIVASVILVMSLFFQKEQTKTSIRNADLYNQLSEKQDQIERDLEIARIVQQGILATATPKITGITISAKCLPTANIGGDFYGVRDKDNKVHFFVGDVSGHGISSALIMTLSYSLINELINEGLTGVKLIKTLNKQLKAYLGETINYLTLFYGIYDKSKNELTYINGGHPPAVIFHKKGTTQLLEHTSPIIGIFDHIKVSQQKISTKDCSKIVVYTDGFIESKLADGTLFTETDFISALEQVKDKTVSQITNTAFKLSQELIVKDDLTLLAITF